MSTRFYYGQMDYIAQLNAMDDIATSSATSAKGYADAAAQSARDAQAAAQSAGTQVNADWNATTGVAKILNKPVFATVATSGSYVDLTNKPVFATVATTGDYNDLINKPTIPTSTSQLTNNSGFITSTASITGNAATATKLQTVRTINGVNFDGSANITISASDSIPRVQNGTGAGQLSNAVKIGWNGTQLLLSVDATDFSASWPMNVQGSATKLATARTISGVSFDGSANIALPHPASQSDGNAVAFSGGDLNAITTTGFYRGQTMTNAPNAGWNYVTHINHDGNWATQTVVAYGSNNTANEIYQRTKAGGTWGSWVRVSDGIYGENYYLKRRRDHFGGANSLKLDDITSPEMGFTYSNTVGGPGISGAFMHFGGLDSGNAANYGCQIVSSYNDASGRMFFRNRNDDNGTWNPWREIYHTGNFPTTINRVNTSGIGYGSYGSVNIAGQQGGYGGFSFSDFNMAFMVNRTYQGSYIDNGSWQWRFDNGLLAVGTVPWASVVNKPTLFVDNGAVNDTGLDSAVANGVFLRSYSGASATMLVINAAGGSTGPVQMDFMYDGTARFRNKTDSSTWTGWKTIITSANIGSQTVAVSNKLQLASGVAGGTTFNWSGAGGQPTWLWGGNSSDNMYVYNPSNFNVLTAWCLRTDRTNYKDQTDTNVVGQLMWKNYGNNHTIFDASAGTAPNGVGISARDSQNAWGVGYPTLMGWNGSNTYGVRVDSARAADRAGMLDGNAFTNGQDGWWRSSGQCGWYNATYGVGIWATEAGNVRTYGNSNFIAEQNITAYSDERFKKNWRAVAPAFVQGLAQVKSGVYDRTDFKATQVGVSAQSLRVLMPEAVLEDADGKLSVNYGAAALVSSVELAKELVACREKLDEQNEVLASLIKRIELLEKK